jgi:hypothetical protein
LPNQFSFPEKIYFLTIIQIPSIPGIYNNLTGQKMYNKKMLLTQHPWLPEAGVEETPGRAGSGNILNVRTLYVKWQFFLHCQKKTVKGWFLKLGCHFFSTWHYLKHNSICTTGQVVKVNNIYTFEEEEVIDIVRMLDVYQASGYLYCTLTIRLFKKLDINIFNNFSNSTNIDLYWIRKLILVFGVVWTALISVTVIHHIFHMFSMVFCTDGLFLSLSIFVILIGYFGLKQKVIFSSEDIIWYQKIYCRN